MVLPTTHGAADGQPDAADGRPEAAGSTAAGPRVIGRGRGGSGHADRVPWLIAGVVFAGYGALSVFRYLRFAPASYDLGIFTEYVRQYAHLHAPVVDISKPGMNLLGDHFHPIVALIAPAFRLFPSAITLVVAQALLAAVSVIPVCRAAAQLLGTGESRVIGAAYGLSWGLQQMVSDDFHEIAFAVPLLACSLSAMVRGRHRAAVAWAVPLVLVKEDQGFTVAAIGLILAWRYRRVAAGLLLAGWGIGCSLIAIYVIIPHFNPAHTYPYWAKGGALSPAAAAVTPGGLAHQLIAGASVKLPTLALILLPTAFLALWSPVVLAAVPGLLLRFISVNSAYWTTAWHYNATAMPVVFIAAVDAMARLRARQPEPGQDRRPPGTARAAARRLGLPLQRHGAALMAGACAALVFQFPLSSLWDPGTYRVGGHQAADRAAMAAVPDGATVETDLNLLAPLAARTDTFWIGTGNPAPQYVVFDTASTDYQPPPRNVPAFVAGMHPGVRYRLIFRDRGVFVFRRVPAVG